MQRLLRKFETAETLLPKPLLCPAAKPARFGAIFYGSTSPAMQEALDVLAERGIHVNALRVRGFPFPDEIADFVASHPWVFVIEQNRDAQLKTLLVNEGQGKPDAAAVGTALRRHPDYRAFHRRSNFSARLGTHRRAAEKSSVVKVRGNPSSCHPDLHLTQATQ